MLDAPAIAATVQWQDLGPVLGTVRRRGGGGSVAASPMARAVSFTELRQRGVSSSSARRRRGGGVLEVAPSNVVCGPSQCSEVRLDEDGGRSDASMVWDTDWNVLGWMTLEMSTAISKRPPAGPSNARNLRRSAMLRRLGVELGGETLRARAASGQYEKLRLTLQWILEKR